MGVVILTVIECFYEKNNFFAFIGIVIAIAESVLMIFMRAQFTVDIYFAGLFAHYSTIIAQDWFAEPFDKYLQICQKDSGHKEPLLASE